MGEVKRREFAVQNHVARTGPIHEAGNISGAHVDMCRPSRG